MTDEVQNVGALAWWDSYRCSRDAGLRHRLIEHYMPLARRAALRTYRYAIQPCSFDDYLQYARLGLIEAVDHYDPARNVPFEVYSKYRIRGAILNGVGRESEAAAQREFVRRAMRERVASLGGTSSASLRELMDLTVGVALGVLLESEELEASDNLAYDTPYAATELRQLATRLRSLVERLPERERAVIAGHYFDCLEFGLLAEQLVVSKGRISQLHSQALKRLQQMLEASPGVNRQL